MRQFKLGLDLDSLPERLSPRQIAVPQSSKLACLDSFQNKGPPILPTRFWRARLLVPGPSTEAPPLRVPSLMDGFMVFPLETRFILVSFDVIRLVVVVAAASSA